MSEEEIEEEAPEEEVGAEEEEPEEGEAEEEEETEEEPEEEEDQEFDSSDIIGVPMVICPDDDVLMDVAGVELKEVEKGGLLGSSTEVHSHVRYECPECGKFYTHDAEGKQPGCFIATAAYGTPMAEEIDVLRDFRDSYLLERDWGKRMVDLYYAVSPPVASVIARSESLKGAFRALLRPIVDFFEDRRG